MNKPLCGIIEFRSLEDDKNVEFKLYKEKDLPMLAHPVMKVEMQEPIMDFDCSTDNEQAESSARAMDTKIADDFKLFETDKSSVNNAVRYLSQKPQGE